jgi:hypothetical protein
MDHQLLGNLFRERRIEPASDVDSQQFLMLALVRLLSVLLAQVSVRLFCVCL